MDLYKDVIGDGDFALYFCTQYHLFIRRWLKTTYNKKNEYPLSIQNADNKIYAKAMAIKCPRCYSFLASRIHE